MQPKSFLNFRSRVDIWLQLLLAALILTGCYLVIQPFLTAIILAAILAVVSWPMYQRALTSLGNNANMAASIMIFVIIVTILIPVTILFIVLGQQIPPVIQWIKTWVHAGFPLPKWIVDMPYVGSSINELFHQNVDIATLSEFLGKAFDPLSKWVLSTSVGIGNSLFQLALVAFIVFFFYRDGPALAQRVRTGIHLVAGSLAKEFTDILVNTTRSVVFGIVGTAIGQGIVAGFGFWLAGVDNIVLLSFLVAILSVIPVGPPLIWGPVAIWLLATSNFGWGIFMIIWGTLAVSGVDNFIKPILISRGSTLPLSLVFLGVLGGMIAFGLLGVVLGPILLSATVAMFQAWIKRAPLPVARSIAQAQSQMIAEQDNTAQNDPIPTSASDKDNDATPPTDLKA